MNAKRIGTALNALSRIAPNTAARATFFAFCYPPPAFTRPAADRRFVERMQPFLSDAESISVATSECTIQTYRWRTKASTSRGTVLLVHGWTGQSLVMALFVKPLRDHGYDVVALDLPGHGKSTGQQLTMPRGARAILAVTERLGPFAGAITHSFGGPNLALALEGGSPLDRSIDIPRVCLISSPDTLDELIDSYGTSLALNPILVQGIRNEIERLARRPIAAIRVSDFVATSGQPTLIIHDADDDVVAISHADAIAARAPNVTLMRTARLGHKQILITPAVVRAATRFIANT
ncbi:MAG: alpha/beta fold hydrolase, partial [Hyphomicrobiaceae bacterium]